MDDARELRRLALLGLERDNDRERVRKDFAEELVASMESNIRNGEAVVAMGIDSNDQSLMREGRLRELAAMFVREMVLACRFKDKLGLEREESRARVEAAAEADTHVELSVLDDSFGAFPDLGLGPDLDLGPEPHEAFLTEERDRERAERVGRAVLADRALMRFAIETAIDTIRNGDGFEPDDVPKLRAIADAMEEP